MRNFPSVPGKVKLDFKVKLLGCSTYVRVTRKLSNNKKFRDIIEQSWLGNRLGPFFGYGQCSRRVKPRDSCWSVANVANSSLGGRAVQPEMHLNLSKPTSGIGLNSGLFLWVDSPFWLVVRAISR